MKKQETKKSITVLDLLLDKKQFKFNVKGMALFNEFSVKYRFVNEKDFKFSIKQTKKTALLYGDFRDKLNEIETSMRKIYDVNMFKNRYEARMDIENRIGDIESERTLLSVYHHDINSIKPSYTECGVGDSKGTRLYDILITLNSGVNINIFDISDYEEYEPRKKDDFE